MDLKTFRAQHPEYGDMNDLDLAKGLHRKFYADMPFEKFAASLSVDAPSASDADLVGQLNYAMPQPPKAWLDPLSGRRHAPTAQAQADYERRTGVLQQLRDRGFDNAQIQTALDIAKRQRYHEMKIGRTSGAAIGSVAGPLLLNLIPGFGALPEEAITIPLAAKLMQAGAGVAGAGVGGAVGEAAQQGIVEERAISAREALHAAGAEMLWEGGVRTGLGLIGAGLAPFIKRIAPKAAQTIDDYAKVGGFYTPAQQDRRLTLRVGEAIARGSFGGQQLFDSFGEIQQTKLASLAWGIVDDLAKGTSNMSDAEIGSMLAETFMRPSGRKWTLVDEVVEPLYTQVRNRARNATVDVGRMKRFATEMLQRDVASKGNLLTDTGRQRLRKIGELDVRTPFNALRDVRSSLLKEERKMALDMNQDAGIVRRLAGLASDAMNDPKAVRGMDAKTRRLLHKANRLYRTASQQWEETFPKRVLSALEKDPQRSLKHVFPAGNEIQIRKMKRMIRQTPSGAPDAEGRVLWDQLRQGWLAEEIGKATTEDTLRPAALERAFKRMGNKALKEVFTPEELRRLRNVVAVAERIKPGGSAGTTLFSKGIQIKAGAQLSGLVLGGYGAGRGGTSGDIMLAAGGILAISPIVFARLATTKGGSELLTAGMKARPGTKQYALIASRILRAAQALDQTEADAHAKAEKQARVRAARLRSASVEGRAITHPARPVGGHHF